mgnify:CR=1 FL=1
MSYLSYPYTLDIKGVVGATDSVSKVYEDRLLTLLSTNIGQRPMTPAYGVDLSKAFFENEYIVDSGNVISYTKSIQQAITEAVQKWIPDITVNDILVGPPNEYGIATLEILITVPGSVTTSLNTTTAVFYANGTITRI